MEPVLRVKSMANTVERSKNLQKTKPQSTEEIRKVAQKFEGMFLENLLKTMRRSIPKGGLIDGGQSEEIFTYMFDQTIAERMAQRGVGLADVIQQQLEMQLDPKVHRVDVKV